MYTYSCTIERVIDGDTVDLVIDLGFHVRLARRARLDGINTPELRSKDPEQRARAHRARMWLEKFHVTGYALTVKTRLDADDKYGRVLATLYANDICINDALIAEGLATRYNGKGAAA